jgi:integrase
MVEDFKSARKQEPLRYAKDSRLVTGATVNRALTTLKLLYHQAERSGYAIKNPAVGVAMFREPLDSMRVITFEEQAAYLSKASQPLRDIAELMLDTGMRPEEVFRIRVENIDFGQKTISNPFGKTKAARRTIPMTDDVLAILRKRAKGGTGRRLYFRRPTTPRNQSAASRRHIEPPSCGPASRGIFGFTICVIRSQHEQWPPAQTCRRSAHCWGMRVF